MSVRNAPLVRDAATGRRVTRWWVAYLVVFVGAVFVVQFGVLGALGQAWKVSAGSPAAQVQEAIACAVSILVVFAWVGWYERRHVRTVGFRRPGRGVLLLLAGILVGLAMISLPILFLWATGAYERVDAPAASGSGGGWAALPLVLALVLLFVFQGGQEEVLTRGFLLQNSGLQLPGWVAIGLPAFIFTVLHGVLSLPLAFVTILLYAVFASFVALQQGSLWLIGGIHAGWNWALGNVWGIPVSGLAPKDESLVYLRPTDGSPDWLTGGTFGTEGSLPAVVMIVAATAVAFVLYRRRARTWADDAEPAAPAPTPPAAESPSSAAVD
ncbi:CPBP family intramembrane glutamic endopeptidase [Cellulosimicrobium cellulans]|uniref:CPBP family intramembrane glutamic endopeptidase n=1 Tax=Cellulosimicrobium cellulans TaxID=1710 RepID=UPI0036EF04F9